MLRQRAVGTSVCTARRGWQDVKRTAGHGRQRTLDHPVDADIALAHADLQLGDTKSATDQLAPYLENVKADPKHNPALTEAVAKLWIATDKIADARTMLQPLLATDANWRRMWLRLGASEIKPADAASDWINTAAPSIDACKQCCRAVRSQSAALAAAWRSAAQQSTRFSTPSICSRRSVDRKDMQVAPILMLAMLQTDANDFVLGRSALLPRADPPKWISPMR